MVETLREKDSSGGWEALRNNFDYTDISNYNKSENLGTVSKILILVTQIRYLVFSKGKKKKKQNSFSNESSKDGKKEVYSENQSSVKKMLE